MYHPCFCDAPTCPECGPRQGYRFYPKGSLDAEDIDLLNEHATPQVLPRDDDNQPMTFDGKRVVLLTSESGTYREWDVQVGGTQYCIVDEDGVWTLLVYDDGWLDAPDDVDTFLATHRLILAD